jgi:hypothetical protein
MPDPAIRLDGAFELKRAFTRLSKDLGGGVKEALESAAEPIRSQASSNARGEISGMARSRIPWWRMRTGVTAHSVYIAPEQRGVKSGRINDRKRRPNLTTVMRPHMERALADNRGSVVSNVQRELSELVRIWGRN